MAIRTVGTVRERAETLRKYALANQRRVLVNSLSGGVDSALSATISREAEAPGLRAVALNIPISLDPAREVDVLDAQRVAAHLGMPMQIVPMTDTWQIVAQVLQHAAREVSARAGIPLDPEQLEWAVNNLKPTLRMLAAGFFADAFAGLMIGTDNAVENFLGYFSIRGDGIADWQPIRDLLKGEVQDTAAAIGLPADLAYRTPTPGLFDFKGHTDEGELGFVYKEADAFVAWILHEEAQHWPEGQSFYLMDAAMTVRASWRQLANVPAGMAPAGLDPAVADRIVAQNQKTFFKRKSGDLAATLRARGLVPQPSPSQP